MVKRCIRDITISITKAIIGEGGAIRSKKKRAILFMKGTDKDVPVTTLAGPETRKLYTAKAMVRGRRFALFSVQCEQTKALCAISFP